MTKRKKAGKKTVKKAGKRNAAKKTIKTAKKSTRKAAKRTAKRKKTTAKKASKKKLAKRSAAKKTTHKKASKKSVAKRTPARKTAKNPARRSTAKTLKKRATRSSTRKSPVRKGAVKTRKGAVRKSPKKAVEATKKTQMIAPKPIERPVRRPAPRYAPVEWTDDANIARTIKVLKDMVRRKDISDWRISYTHKRSAEVYLGIDGALESTLDGLREDLLVTIHCREGALVGEAEIPIIATTEKQIRDELTRALAICARTCKPGYELPEPTEVRFPRSADEQMLERFREGTEMEIPLGLADQITSVASGVALNNAEVLASASGRRVITSTGVDVSWHATEVYVQVTLTAEHEGEEQEFYWSTTAVSPRQLNLRSQITRQIATVTDAARAGPCEGFEGDVLLSGQSLLDFFAPNFQENPLIVHASAKLKLMGLSRLERGQALGEFKGEPFSITSDPSLPLATRSAPVDIEGTALRPIDILQTGVFIDHLATARYAARLGLALTGEVANIRVGDGATREEHLRGLNYVEIVQFSWFNPDPFSGDFSAEIRLGYHWKYGKRTPFKGGQFVGNVFENLLNCRLSREVIQSGRYYGPRALLFKNATITKGA